ncbi:MAG: nitroreductase family protein [Desulfobulbus sp.]|jgi:nitroreductase|uniref:nitroreductase family protein n=1 Tax=Desulfobulbus sp. TaxID=895 RepID=UPI00284249D0|nr:nitroreductase family protein [Desulfobulbus sp.]MDR2550314.1 nitroreductase family protein [Desulfobulbus sp.]
MIEELVRRTRTVRRFVEQKAIETTLLHAWVDLARLGGSARNAQSLKYMIVTAEALRTRLLPLLGWAGYLPDWPGPDPGERPAAYIVCLLDTALARGPENEAHFDLGIATQNLLLGAAAQGVFGCRIGAFSAEKVHRLLELEPRFKVLLVLALGYPAETVVMEEVGPDGDIRYWHDELGVHHVPKRSLTEMLVSPPVPQ